MTESMPLLESVASEFRIAVRILEETWGGLRRSAWMNLVIVITMASILSIFGSLLAFFLETQNFIASVGAGVQISAYLKDSADVGTVRQQIQALPHISKIETVSREQAWEEMKATYDVPDIPNPLPATLHVLTSDSSYIEDVAKKITAIEGVETVSFAKNVLQKLETFSRILSAVGMSLTSFFGLLTLFIISNTIHLLIEARGREIEILRMMGVSNWYIRLPFFLQGATYGLVGSVIACFPLSFVELTMAQIFEKFDYTISSQNQPMIIMTMLIIGIIVGSGGAMVSIHRYLKI